MAPAEATRAKAIVDMSAARALVHATRAAAYAALAHASATNSAAGGGDRTPGPERAVRTAFQLAATDHRFPAASCEPPAPLDLGF